MRKGYLINIVGDKEKQVLIPDNWKDCTIGDLLKFKNSDDIFSLLANFTGYTIDQIKKAPPNVFDDIIEDLTFLDSPIAFGSLPVPGTMKINGKNYPTSNKKIESIFTFSQKIEAVDIITKYSFEEDNPKAGEKKKDGSVEPDKLSKVDVLCASPELVAIYYYPIVTGEDFDNVKYKDFIPVVYELPCLEIIPFGNFFLKKFRDLKKFGGIDLSQIRSSLEKTVSASNVLGRITFKFLEYSARLMIWQQEIIRSMTNGITKT